MSESPKQNKHKKTRLENRNGKNFVTWLIFVLAAVYLLRLGTLSVEGPAKELPYGEFYRILTGIDSSRSIKDAVMRDSVIEGRLSTGEKFKVDIPEQDPELIKALRTNITDFKITRDNVFMANLLPSLISSLVFIGLLWLFFWRGSSQGGGKLLSFGKSRARLMGEEKLRVTFKDAAGVDEAQEELMEVIEFLKDPKRFQKLGGKMPKGVLLIGPPGSGKTLLAKAVAGEADVPFFNLSGSDFVEMFVGVGASRVRDLFEQAKRSAKQSQKGCIIFIDEIDAVGRQRFAGIGGGHDEREQTLNALLVEMDGFNTQAGVILIAATNRPDVLDPALLRPGRFDRIVVIDRPDIIGREAILKVHANNVKADKDVDLKRIAKQTSGFSGADLANLINEAALLAARRNKQSVTMKDMEEAIERIWMGPEKKSRVISKAEKSLTAYHESGHAILSLFISDADPMHKVSILPRGVAGGYTLMPPMEDRHYFSRKKLMAGIIVALGGRASEEITFKEISTGASSDLKAITEKARDMVTRYGMSPRLGNLTFGKPYEEVFLGRDIAEERNYSDETARIIDEEVKKIVDECYGEAKRALLEHKNELDLLAAALLEKEVMNDDEVKSLLKLSDSGATQENISDNNANKN